MGDRLTYTIIQFQKVLRDFRESLSIRLDRFDEQTIDVIKNGQIQKFEFTTEIFWKTVKVFLLDIHGFDLASPKQVIRKYFELGYCSYETCELLLLAVEYRNQMSHIYKKETYLEIHRKILSYGDIYATAAKAILDELSSQDDTRSQ